MSGQGKAPDSQWFSDVATTGAVAIGNTLGAVIPYPCDKCGKWSRISSYGGNVVEGDMECPRCRRFIFGQNNDNNRKVECHYCLKQYQLDQFRHTFEDQKGIFGGTKVLVVRCPGCNHEQ